MKILVVFLACLTLFLSCLNKASNDDAVSLGLIEFKIDIEGAKTHIEDRVDSVEIVPFEFSTESILSEISKIDFFKERYYVLDNAQHDLKIFGANGVFIDKINSFGKGPGEYLFLTDFTIQKDREQLVLLAQEKNTLLLYSLLGDHVCDVEMDRDILLLSCIQFWGNQFFYFAHNPKQGSLNQLHISDENFAIKSSQLPSDMKSSTVLTFNAFSVRNNDVTFHYPQENRVYGLDGKNKFQPIYTFNFGKYQLPEQAIELLKKEPDDEADIMVLNNAIAGYVVVGKVIVLNDYIYIDFVHRFQKQACLIDLRTGENCLIENRIHGLNMRNVVGSIDNSNTLVVAIEPADYYGTFKDGFLSERAVSKMVAEHVNNELAMNNPWILKIHLR